MSHILDRPVSWVKVDSALQPISKFKYEPARSRGWWPIQRICFWLLDKIGCAEQQTIEVFTRTQQENNDLVSSLLGQSGQWLERGWRFSAKQNGATIFIGPEARAELLALLRYSRDQPVTFAGAIHIGHDGELYWHTIRVVVVPWMTGAILVPNDWLRPMEHQE